MAEFGSGLGMMMILAEEEKVREGKKLLEMSWRMEEARCCLNNVRVVGCNIFEIWMSLDRIGDYSFGRRNELGDLDLIMKILGEKQRLRPKCMRVCVRVR